MRVPNASRPPLPLEQQRKKNWGGGEGKRDGGWEEELGGVSGCLECKHEPIISSGGGESAFVKPASVWKIKAKRPLDQPEILP